MTTDTKSIVVQYDIPQAPALVWRALTEPELLEKWLMKNDIAPIVGHRFTFRTTHPQDDWDGVAYCEVLLVEPEKRLRYSWRHGDPDKAPSGHVLNTLVTWTLKPAGNGTMLLLEHEGFRDEDAGKYEDMTEGWSGNIRTWMLEELALL